MSGDVQAAIHDALVEGFAPSALEVINESGMHNVPKGSQTHFKVVIVSDRFAGESLVKRHRAVNGVLADQLAAGVHALSIKAHTPEEWTARGGVVPDSPPCRGGSKLG